METIKYIIGTELSIIGGKVELYFRFILSLQELAMPEDGQDHMGPVDDGYYDEGGADFDGGGFDGINNFGERNCCQLFISKVALYLFQADTTMAGTLVAETWISAAGTWISAGGWTWILEGWTFEKPLSLT